MHAKVCMQHNHWQLLQGILLLGTINLPTRGNMPKSLLAVVAAQKQLMHAKTCDVTTETCCKASHC